MSRVQYKTRDYVAAVPLPDYGPESKYAVVEHMKAIRLISKCLLENGFNIVDEQFRINNGGNVVLGKLILDKCGDSEMQSQIVFLNSYDKTQRFKMAAGLIHKESGNSFLLSNTVYGTYKRKHIKNANSDIEEAVCEICANLNQDFDILIEQKKNLKDLIYDRKDIIQSIAELYIEKDLILDTQMSIIKKELDDPSHNYNCDALSAWYLYMTIAKSFADSSSKNYYEKHQKLNEYFQEKWKDYEEFIESWEEQSTDPNQEWDEEAGNAEQEDWVDDDFSDWDNLDLEEWKDELIA